jgi:hypothetical protein
MRPINEPRPHSRFLYSLSCTERNEVVVTKVVNKVLKEIQIRILERLYRLQLRNSSLNLSPST